MENTGALPPEGQQEPVHGTEEARAGGGAGRWEMQPGCEECRG